MKKAHLIITLLLVYQASYGQLLNESFDNGLPSNWTQGNGNVTWTANSTLGTSNSGCAMANFSSSSGQGNNWLQSPFVNLTTLSNPEISFSLALIGNNTVAPNLSLWYDNGNGWQQLSTWGNNSTANTITQTFDNNPPLNTTNVTWVNASFSLAQLATNTNIRFSFGADFSNGGWVLVDNVEIKSGQASTIYNLPYTQEFEGSTFIPTDWEAFGGTNAAWQRSTSVGGFGTSSACMYFDNFSNPGTNGNFYGLRCVPLNLTGSTKPTLEFDVAYAQRSGVNSDRLGIWYSYNGVTGWTNLQNYDNANLTTAPNTNNYFTPTGMQWKKITLDLSQFSTASYIRFAFENNSAGGNVVYVDNVRFFDDGPVAVRNTQELEQISIYPNPSSGLLHIKNKNAHSISILSITGNVLSEQTLYNGQSDITHLSNGLYLVKILNEKKKTIGVSKIWKQNR